MKRLIFLSILVMVLFTSCVIINVNPFGSVRMSSQKSKVSKNSVLHILLSGEIVMYSSIDGSFAFLGSQSESAHDLILKIRSAKDDKRITAIILQPQGLNAGYTTLNEIKAALTDFKDSGKKIYGYIDMGSNQDMYLLSVADELYMNPSASAGFIFSGVGSNIVFMKDLLDKIGVEAHVIRAGEYKSAGEPFTRTEMSTEMRENFTEIISDLYEQLLSDFAEGYELEIDRFRYLFEDREKYFINLTESISIGVIDELMFFDMMLYKLGINERQLVRHTQYAPMKIKQQRNNIAVVYMSGNIVSGGGSFSSSDNITSREYVKIFDEIIANDNIKAVVIRVNSGGGSALESEIIHAKISQLKERKPVVVSLGGTAASGGYYIISGADYIFADPYTITGSIGVFSMLFDVGGAAEKLGLNFEAIGHGKFFNAGSPFVPFNSEIAEALQLSTEDTYLEFKFRVANGRKIDLDDVEKIAQGQVWSASKALQHNLVDEIGLIDNAINKAIEMSQIGTHSLLYYPTKRSFMSSFMAGFNVSDYFLFGNRSLPLQKETEYFLNLIDDVLVHPVQMRSEMIMLNEAF